jgi:hypothetical protein
VEKYEIFCALFLYLMTLCGYGDATSVELLETLVMKKNAFLLRQGKHLLVEYGQAR